ncbi:MAG: alanine racemase [Bacilli bacterium]|jgi:alanine racemase|nr:alanine racemase [Bacilli bacterium]MDY0064353.1 alanine racemase [Bacilli bacterium]
MIVIHLNQLKKNLAAIRRFYPKVIGVVKNNAYGHGAVRIAQELVKEQVDYLFVNEISEAIILLEAGIEVPIMIHNSLPYEQYALLNQYPNLVITINSLAEVYEWLKYPLKQIRVQIQIDTLMNRLGIKTISDAKEAIDTMKNNAVYQIEGIYTHFASPGASKKQVALFEPFTKLMDFPMIHCAASSTYQLISFGNYARVGLELYNLNQVMDVVAKPISIRMLPKHTSVGYNEEYTAQEDEKIAVLPLGYGNGYTRRLQGFYVLCKNKKYPIVGRICMNHIFVKIDEDITCDDLFELTSLSLPASELANYIGSSIYEVNTMFCLQELIYDDLS